MVGLMRHLFTLAVALSCTLIAAEPAPVLAELVIPDGASLTKAWNTSPYGVVWNATALDSVRERFAANRQELVEKHGLDPLTVLSQSGTIHLALVGLSPAGDQPPLVLTVAAGAQAETWFTALAAKSTLNLDGSAALDSGWTLRRDGPTLILSSLPNLARPAAPTLDRTHQLSLHLDGPSLSRALDTWTELNDKPLKDADLDLAKRFLGTVLNGTIDMTADGLTLAGTATPSQPGLAPLDRAAFDRLPTTVLEVAAVGIDGKRLWSEVVAPIAERARANGNDPEAAMKKQGIDLPLAELVTGLGGTWILVLGQGMPMPTVTIFSPPSPVIDRFATTLLTKAGVELPKPGVNALIPLPIPLPISLNLAHDARGWILTTDIAGAAAQLTGSGWLTSPLGTIAGKKLTPTTCGLSVCDTVEQLRLISSLMGMGLGASKDFSAKDKQAILAIPGQLAAKATPSWWTITDDGKQLHFSSEGLGIGFTGSSLPVLAGALLPMIGKIGSQAKRVNSGSNMRQLVISALVYGNDNDGKWPANLTTLQEQSGGALSDEVFRSPGDPTIKAPYCYIRPDERCGGLQPVIIEDPACWKGKGCNVVYGDSHMKWHDKAAAAKLWTEAQRLAALPSAATTGITWNDWSAVHEILDPKPHVTPAKP